MIGLLCFFLTLFASLFKSQSRLEAENAAPPTSANRVAAEVRGRIQSRTEIARPRLLMLSGMVRQTAEWQGSKRVGG
jgi:hypothetical protein